MRVPVIQSKMLAKRSPNDAARYIPGCARLRVPKPGLLVYSIEIAP
jgi:hypothetical protein